MSFLIFPKTALIIQIWRIRFVSLHIWGKIPLRNPEILTFQAHQTCFSPRWAKQADMDIPLPPRESGSGFSEWSSGREPLCPDIFRDKRQNFPEGLCPLAVAGLSAEVLAAVPSFHIHLPKVGTPSGPEISLPEQVRKLRFHAVLKTNPYPPGGPQYMKVGGRPFFSPLNAKWGMPFESAPPSKGKDFYSKKWLCSFSLAIRFAGRQFPWRQSFMYVGLLGPRGTG